MPKNDNKILKYNHGEKSQFVIYADMESLLEKKDTCHNNPENSLTTEKDKHTASGHLLFIDCSFDATKNKLSYYREKYYMKKFYKDLRKHATKRVNFEKKEMIPLTIEEIQLHGERKVCYICKK